MPFYEYRCVDCDRIFDEYQSMYEEHTANCPGCGMRAQRKFTPVRHKITFIAGYDAGAGKTFNSKHERDNFLAENNMRVKSF